MKIKYSPIKASRDTKVEVIDENTLRIDGAVYQFPSDCVEFPEVAEQTEGAIIRAERKAGELWVEVLRRYTSSFPWDTGEYHDVKPEKEDAGESDIGADAGRG